MEPMETAKSEAAKQAVIFFFAVLTMLVIMATTNPDFLRTLKMRVAAVSSRTLDWLSHAAGHTSMGIELQTGVQKYAIPYRLSRLRDMASRKYKEVSDGC